MSNEVRRDISLSNDFRVFRTTQTLLSLDLWNNQVQDRGAEDLGQAIAKNKVTHMSSPVLYAIYYLR